MTRGRAAAACAALAAALACSHARRVAQEAPAPERRAAQGRSGGKGVPAAPGRPAAPASPEGLLAPDAVKDVQRALADRGYLGAHREGDLDDATSAAIMRFQRERGLAATGMPDRETVAQLGLDPEDVYRRVRGKE